MPPPWSPCGPICSTPIGFSLSGCGLFPNATLGFGWNPFLLIPLLEYRERRRSTRTLRSLSRLSLENKHQHILWWGPTSRLDFLDTGHVQGRKTHALLGRDEM